MIARVDCNAVREMPDGLLMIAGSKSCIALCLRSIKALSQLMQGCRYNKKANKWPRRTLNVSDAIAAIQITRTIRSRYRALRTAGSSVGCPELAGESTLLERLQIACLKGMREV